MAFFKRRKMGRSVFDAPNLKRAETHGPVTTEEETNMFPRQKSRPLFFLTFLLILMSTWPSWAQRQDGTISGTVKDPSGAVIGNATVTITSDQTGQVRTVQTSNVGTYFVPNLLVGNYTVKIESAGFAVSPAA